MLKEGRPLLANPFLTSSRANLKLERVLLDLSGRSDFAFIGGSHYTTAVWYDFARYTWVLLLKHKSNTEY